MAIRALIIYVVILVRVGEKRFIGKNTAFDVIIGIILGSVLSRAITGNGDISVIKSDREPRVVDVAVLDGVQTIRIELA